MFSSKKSWPDPWEAKMAHTGGLHWVEMAGPQHAPVLSHWIELNTVMGGQGGAAGCCQLPALLAAGSLLKEKLSVSLHV